LNVVEPSPTPHDSPSLENSSENSVRDNVCVPWHQRYFGLGSVSPA
jgi:hypothetical protein